MDNAIRMCGFSMVLLVLWVVVKTINFWVVTRGEVHAVSGGGERGARGRAPFIGLPAPRPEEAAAWRRVWVRKLPFEHDPAPVCAQARV